jgi:hypothetical protein
MKSIYLHRVAYHQDGTFGVLLDESEPFAVTLEPEWLDNKKDSCIPEGRYVCERFTSGKHGKTWMVKDVPGRSFILFHKGNTEEDSEGCILLGEQFFRSGDKASIANSGAGFAEFLDRLKDDSAFMLYITSKKQNRNDKAAD